MIFPPFDPERAENRRRRFRAIPVRTLVPNLITLLALCAGLTAIRLSVEGKLEWALGAIVFAAILEPGLTDYIVLQLPTGDMTLDEARRTMEVFITEVKPQLEQDALAA